MGIYKIVNKKTNKIYIGSSNDIRLRWNSHKSLLDRGEHTNIHLQRAWDKYSCDSFRFEMVLLCEEFELLRYEQWFLDTTVRWGVDYNFARNATAPMLGLVGAFTGRTHTKEAKRKMSESSKGIHSGENNPSSKLTKEDIIIIKQWYCTGNYTQTLLGKMFGVSQAQIWRIINNKLWVGV